jgi:hypothetical protein
MRELTARGIQFWSTQKTIMMPAAAGKPPAASGQPPATSGQPPAS